MELPPAESALKFEEVVPTGSDGDQGTIAPEVEQFIHLAVGKGFVDEEQANLIRYTWRRLPLAGEDVIEDYSLGSLMEVPEDYQLQLLEQSQSLLLQELPGEPEYWRDRRQRLRTFLTRALNSTNKQIIDTTQRNKDIPKKQWFKWQVQYCREIWREALYSVLARAEKVVEESLFQNWYRMSERKTTLSRVKKYVSLMRRLQDEVLLREPTALRPLILDHVLLHMVIRPSSVIINDSSYQPERDVEPDFNLIPSGIKIRKSTTVPSGGQGVGLPGDNPAPVDNEDIPLELDDFAPSLPPATNPQPRGGVAGGDGGGGGGDSDGDSDGDNEGQGGSGGAGGSNGGSGSSGNSPPGGGASGQGSGGAGQPAPSGSGGSSGSTGPPNPGNAMSNMEAILERWAQAAEKQATNSLDVGVKEDLPTFYGDHREWDLFYQQFLALVDKNKKLSTIVKFKKLLDALAGEARDHVRNVSFTEENYDMVKTMLVNQYGRERNTLADLIRQLQAFGQVSENYTRCHQYATLVDEVIQRQLRRVPGLAGYMAVPLSIIKSNLHNHMMSQYQLKMGIFKLMHNREMTTEEEVNHLRDFLVAYARDMRDRGELNAQTAKELHVTLGSNSKSLHGDPQQRVGSIGTSVSARKPKKNGNGNSRGSSNVSPQAGPSVPRNGNHDTLSFAMATNGQGHGPLRPSRPPPSHGGNGGNGNGYSRPARNGGNQSGYRPREGNGAQGNEPRSYQARDPQQCCFCRGNHAPRNCRAPKPDPSVAARQAMDAQLCLGCLKQGHWIGQCKTPRPCGKDGCQKKHHVFLHKQTTVTRPRRR